MRLIFLIIAFLFVNQTLFSQNVVLTLVYDKETQSSAEAFEKIMSEYFSDIEIKALSYQDYERQEKKLSFLRLPFGVFSQSLKDNDRMLFALAFNHLIVPFQSYYIVNPDVFLRWGEKILKRKKIKGRLDIFSMGFCPACRHAEYIIADYLKKHSPDFSLHMRFVGRISKEGKIVSLHGTKEVEEDIIEKIIEVHFPAKLLDYLIKKKETLDARKILASLGIEEKMWRKYYQEGKELVKEDIKFADSLGVNSTPTFLWQNVFMSSDFSSLFSLIKAYIAKNGKSSGK
ncbi:MAG: hypothetical protein J7J25_04975 [Candidatus Omnitrophica bacterium]|nr:hypothetical protein [Candidatus Omnitrophota bacterium]